MPIVALDHRLAELVDLNVKPEKIAGGFSFTEGPVWDHRERALIFVDLHFAEQDAGIIYRWTEAGGARVFRQPSFNSNGNTFDHNGCLITCEGDNKRIVRTTPDGGIETVAHSYDGRRLNGPNDVICDPNGDIIFTDPYVALRGELYPDPPPVPAVYRVCGADGTLSRLTEAVTVPNGLAMTGDGRRLYVDHTREGQVWAFDVSPDGRLDNARIFCELKTAGLPREFAAYLDAQVPEGGRRLPDGMKLDSLGNLYVTSNRNEGIWVFDPRGALLGCIGVGEEQNVFGPGLGGPANLAWGDEDWQTLYITSVTSVYRLRMKVAGQPVRQ